jgi:hypothetical protein
VFLAMLPLPKDATLPPGSASKQMSTGDRTIKLARIAWTVLAQRRNYETRVVTGAA